MTNCTARAEFSEPSTGTRILHTRSTSTPMLRLPGYPASPGGAIAIRDFLPGLLQGPAAFGDGSRHLIAVGCDQFAEPSVRVHGDSCEPRRQFREAARLRSGTRQQP